MNSNFQAMLTERNHEVKNLRRQLADSRSEMVTIRNNWMQVFEDLQAEHAKAIRNKESINKVLEKRNLKAEMLINELKDKNFVMKQEFYATQTELEEERGKIQKLMAQINKNYENSSVPSSMKPNRKLITNNREKSGKAPSGQLGHEGHGRKKQVATKVIE